MILIGVFLYHITIELTRKKENFLEWITALIFCLMSQCVGFIKVKCKILYCEKRWHMLAIMTDSFVSSFDNVRFTKYLSLHVYS